MGMPQPMVPKEAFPSTRNNEFVFPSTRNNEFEVLGHLEGSEIPKDTGKKFEHEAIEPNLGLMHPNIDTYPF
jgi:hypothetical protein